MSESGGYERLSGVEKASIMMLALSEAGAASCSACSTTRR